MNREILNRKASLDELVKQLHRLAPKANVTRGLDSGKIKWIVEWPISGVLRGGKVAHIGQREAVIRATSRIMNDAAVLRGPNEVR